MVRELDRLSRSLAKQLIVEEELRRHGIQIAYCLAQYDDTPEGSLLKNVRAVVAEYERLKIVERLVRGRRLKVKGGSVIICKRPPYGYQAVENGGKVSLQVYEPEARIVRLIFTWYAEGDGERGPMSITEIARRLSDMAIPTYADTAGRTTTRKKRGMYQWSRAVVYKILKSETYAGTWRYGKRGTQNGHYIYNPGDALVPVAIPGIVSHRLWETVQERLKQRRHNEARETRYPYLLARRLTCGLCGLKVRATTVWCSGRRAEKRYVYAYYRCPAVGDNMQYTHPCAAPRFNARQVDRLVWECVKARLSSPAAAVRRR